MHDGMGAGPSARAAATGQPHDPILATIYLYDPAGRLTDAWLPYVNDADPNSPTYNQSVRPHWHYTYDPNGNELSQTDPDGHTTTFTYDEQGRQTSRTLPDGQPGGVQEGQQTEYDSYDALGRALTRTDFDGQTTAYEYDSLGRLSKEWRFTAGVAALNADGTIRTSAAREHTEYGYDALGRQYQVNEYVVSTLVRTETSTYDPLTGQVASVTSPEGTVHYEYDPATGRHVETWAGTSHANATTDTLYGYDAQGRLASVSLARANNHAAAAFPGSVRYDAAGHALDTTLPTTLYAYDAAGNLTATALPDGLTTAYAYDVLDRLTLEQVTRDDPSTPAVVEATPVATFDYDYFDDAAATDAAKRRLMIQDDGQRGGVVETRYDAAGSVFSRVAVDYAYDADGRLVRETQDVGFDGAAAPAGEEDFTDTYAYDLAGNRLSKTHDAGSDGTTDTVNRDLYGEIDAAGNLVTPNGDGRLRWEIVTDGSGTEISRTEYRYDANGATTFTQTTTGGVAGDVHEMYYDLRGRLSEADIGDGAGNYASQTTYAHDASGLVVRSVDDLAGGDVGHTSYYLTDANNPTGYDQILEEHHADTDGPDTLDQWINSAEIGLTVIAQAGGVPLTYFVTDGHGSTRATADYQGNITATYDYDAAGNLLSTALPDGLTTAYAYDVLDRLTDELVTRDDLTTSETVEADPVLSFHYTLQDDGQRTGVVEKQYDDGTVFSQTAIAYQYDNDGRLIAESQDMGADGTSVPAGEEDFTDTYAYDLTGNRIIKVHDAGSDGTTDTIMIHPTPMRHTESKAALVSTRRAGSTPVGRAQSAR